MKRIHYLLIILAAMIVYAGKIWVIPLLPETITVDGKFIIKKPMLYLSVPHKKRYTLSDGGDVILITFSSSIRSASIFYSFTKEKDENVFLLRARLSTGIKDIKTNICYLKEVKEKIEIPETVLYRRYAIYAYPYIAGFDTINSDWKGKRMKDFMRQICKDENGTDRRIITLETKIQDQSHPPKSQIPIE